MLSMIFIKFFVQVKPPTIEIAEDLFKNLYFNKDRYDLSEVGRVKLNAKLNLKLKIEKQF